MYLRTSVSGRCVLRMLRAIGNPLTAGDKYLEFMQYMKQHMDPMPATPKALLHPVAYGRPVNRESHLLCSSHFLKIISPFELDAGGHSTKPQFVRETRFHI